MVGDFNVVRHSNKRQGVGHARVNRSKIKGFNNFIDSNQLLDLLAMGRKYTWYRPNDTTKSRLDRVLVSDNWVETWPGLGNTFKIGKCLTIAP